METNVGLTLDNKTLETFSHGGCHPPRCEEVPLFRDLLQCSIYPVFHSANIYHMLIMNQELCRRQGHDGKNSKNESGPSDIMKGVDTKQPCIQAITLLKL